jgi:hemerythrin
MSLTEWNKTTPVVIETIDNIQKLLSKIYNDDQTGLRDAYTKAAKDQINEFLKPLNIVMFDANYNVTLTTRTLSTSSTPSCVLLL